MPIANNTVTEWTFTGDVQALINEILRERPDLGFSEARIEERGRGQLKRRDLTLYDNNARCALSGEIKMPDKADGRTPYGYALVTDAHDKADHAGIEYFFTWNVNRLVLWKTFDRDTPIINRDYLYWDVTEVRESAEVDNPRVRLQIKTFLIRFIETYSRIYRGDEIVRTRPLDERFIHILESALESPVVLTLFAIGDHYAKSKRFEASLNSWMRDEQGWFLADNEQVLRDNLERAAKFSCYVLVNKIVFYTALRRRFRRLTRIRIPAEIKTGAELKDQFFRYFEDAKQTSHDYQTVFDGDFGDDLPFLNDAAVDSWRELINQIEGFDFTQLDYDIIGHIFERLISPEERHRYGQHYTKTEIVDLINAFCIRDATAQVLDPACGGGTFLVRAYARKRYLAERPPEHAELLEQIKGIDISAYPAHLSTINLATRQLVDAENYPLVARSDFFNVSPDRPVFHIPLGPASRGGQQMTMLQVGHVDAVIGNPPYIRQELLDKDFKVRLAELVEGEFPGTKLTKRSDIYVHFFPHAAAFLRGPGSYLGFLTSIGWLDTDYGFKLQKFFLDHFRIVAVLESSCEPWFTGARVTTAVTILQLEPDAQRRLDNLIRFVQIRRPLKDFYPEDSTSSARLETADKLRDAIENYTENHQEDRWRVRVVRQEELYRQGCWIPAETEEDEEENDGPVQMMHSEVVIRGEQLPPYQGGKWGVYLRAPDIFFELMDHYGSNFAPLRELAEVRFGVKTGCDDFFSIEDITEEALREVAQPSLFRDQFGIARSQARQIRIVRSGDKSVHTLEAAFMVPEIHSLMEIDSVRVSTETLHRRLLLVGEPRARLRGTHVGNYIRWGERQTFHERPTCASRDPWYDLTSARRPPIIYPKIQQYRHIVVWNEALHLCASSLLEIFPKVGIPAKALCAVLNSTICALIKHTFGRQHGREGSLQLDVYAANMMLVPDLRKVNPASWVRLEELTDEFGRRKAQNLPDEFALADRRELDDLILQLIGMDDPVSRADFLERLYEAIRDMYRATREAELEMQKFRLKMARRERITPRSLAKEIWENLDKEDIRHFPQDFTPKNVDVEDVELAPAKRVRIQTNLFKKTVVSCNGNSYEFDHPDLATFVGRALEEGLSGWIAVPEDPQVCREAVLAYDNYRGEMEAKYEQAAAEYTAKQDWQKKIVAELWKLYRAARSVG